jgi:probable rRNA maturation factor
MPDREVSVASRHPRLRFDRRAVALLIHLLDREFPRPPRFPVVPPGELSIVFLTDAALAQLHADFLDDPTTTDVITFEGDPVLGTAGEICVSADTAAAYSKKHDRDFSSELALYVVHGWLHLAGYDDLQPAKKRLMRRAETRAMELLRSHAGLPTFTLRPAKASGDKTTAIRGSHR